MTVPTEATLIRLTETLTINGVATKGTGTLFQVMNPATGEVLGELHGASVEQAHHAIASAREAFDDQRWSGLSASERSAAISRLADLIERNQEELARIIVSEVGTPISTARSIQIGQPVATLRYFAQAALEDFSEHLKPSPSLDSISMVDHVPVGVVAAISAYNFPITLAMWKVGAALAAGCTVVLISSPKTPFATLALGGLLSEAGIPDGVVNILAGGPEISSLMTTHPSVDKVAFTGSAKIGELVMGQAAHSLKGVVLELGGKSAAIIMPETDLEDVTDGLIRRLSRNAGQACAAPTRFLVHEDQIVEFERIASRVVSQVEIGDPLDERTWFGPLISEEHRAHVSGMVQRAEDQGARILAQGAIPEGATGYFYPLTLISDAAQRSEIVQDEVFGPVAVVSTYRTIDEAVEMANDSEYGLQGYVFGSDPVHATAVGRQLRAGTIVINGGGGGARVDAPFGGMKKSGIGRELGRWGLDEYLEARHMQIATASPRKAR